VRAVVVIPTYDEAGNVERLIPSVLAQSPDLSVVVVDDASPDGTGSVVERLRGLYGDRLVLRARPAKAGHGSACREGLLGALAAGHHEALFVMDADHSHDPAAIPVLLEALETADVAVGSRYVPGGRISGWGAHRLAMSRTANAVARALLRVPIRDCTSGFMGFRRSALLAIPLSTAREEGYAAPVEVKWLCHRAGLRMAEVPITFRDREEGTSKLGFTQVVGAACGLLRLRAGRATRPAGGRPAPSAPDPPPTR
jgi:dolichol-phosphate mannosyltransferase